MHRPSRTFFALGGILLLIVAALLIGAPRVDAAPEPGVFNLTPEIPATPTPEPPATPQTVETPPPTQMTIPTPWPTEPPRRRPTRTPEPTVTPSPTATPEPWLTNIRVTKQADKTVARFGDEVLFTIVGENVGTHTAFDVVVTDEVPAVFEILGIDSTKGDIVAEGQRVTAYPSRLEPGEQVAITVRARVGRNADPGRYPNTAMITTTTTGDDPGDNSSTVEIAVPPASLPRTSVSQQSPLDTAAPYIPWAIAAVCIVAVGAMVATMARRRTAPASGTDAPAAPAAAAPAAAAPVVSSAPTLPTRLQAAPPVAGLGEPLPPPASVQPLPPRAASDRDAALRHVRPDARPDGEA